MEYILYCDESSQRGPRFSDFFGGCLISSKDLPEITNALNTKKAELYLLGEIKWSKVTSNYLSKYIELMTLFFSYVKSDKIKIRIMFRDNKDVSSNSATISADDKYFKLYYQFIKHAFGFMHIKSSDEPIYIRVYLDQLPDKKVKCAEFKQYIVGLPKINDYKNSPVIIREEDVAEVRSHDHVLLQCLDVVLGAMFFRLNLLNKVVPEGKNRRGNRTVAKEKLYKHIRLQIEGIFPHFNIGESTGEWNIDYPGYYWKHSYRHWKFKPN